MNYFLFSGPRALLAIAAACCFLSGCVEPPSDSCERTLSCADASVVQLDVNCRWLVPEGADWPEAPILTDAGIWLWYGREVTLSGECSAPIPGTPIPPFDAGLAPVRPPLVIDAEDSGVGGSPAPVDATAPAPMVPNTPVNTPVPDAAIPLSGADAAL